MSTSLIPTASTQAINRIDSSLKNSFVSMKNSIAMITAALTQTAKDEGGTYTQAEIIAAGGDKYANLLAYVAAMKTAVNIADPGTYPE